MVNFQELKSTQWPANMLDKNFWVWGVSDHYCLDCSTPFYLLSSKVDGLTSTDLSLVCFTGEHFQSPSNIQPDVLRLLLARGRLTIESLGDLTNAADWLTRTLSIEVSTTAMVQHVDLSSTEVPSGYKSIGWIKPVEAQAILAAQAASADQNLANFGGSSKVSVIFHDKNSQEATKYHSQFELARSNKSFWIRPEEAEAIIESYETRKNIEFQHLHYGHGGLVEFYDSSHPAAIRFRSQTRLLRKSR